MRVTAFRCAMGITCLIALVAAWTAGVSLVGLAIFLGIFLGGWIAVALVVVHDAKSIGYSSPDQAGSVVVVLGLLGLVWWLWERRRHLARPATE